MWLYGKGWFLVGLGGFKWVNFEDEKMKVLLPQFDKKLHVSTKPTPI